MYLNLVYKKVGHSDDDDDDDEKAEKTKNEKR